MYLLTLRRFTDNLIHIDPHACAYTVCNKNSTVYEKKKKDRLQLCAYTRMSSTVRSFVASSERRVATTCCFH